MDPRVRNFWLALVLLPAASLLLGAVNIPYPPTAGQPITAASMTANLNTLASGVNNLETAGAASLSAHTSRTDNPHGTTAAQVGAVAKSGDTMTGNLKITPAVESWAEGLSFIMPNTGTWGGLRWRRERAGYDGNWAIGYQGLDASDDLTFWTGGNRFILRLRQDGVVSVPGDGYLLAGPNSTWGASLRVGGNGNVTNDASICATNGNMHIDSLAGAYGMYLNFYRGTGGVIFGNGAQGIAAKMDSSGQLWLGDSGSKYWNANNDGSGSGLDADTVDGVQAADLAPARAIWDNKMPCSDNTADNTGYYAGPIPNGFGHQAYTINHHTGLRLGAHSAYRGVEIWNQDGAPNYATEGTLKARFANPSYINGTINLADGLLTLNSGGYASFGSWLSMPNNVGMYWPGEPGSPHIYPAAERTFGSVCVRGRKNSWTGLDLWDTDSGTHHTVMTNTNAFGVHKDTFGWMLYWNGESWLDRASSHIHHDRTFVPDGRAMNRDPYFRRDIVHAETPPWGTKMVPTTVSDAVAGNQVFRCPTNYYAYLDSEYIPYDSSRVHRVRLKVRSQCDGLIYPFAQGFNYGYGQTHVNAGWHWWNGYVGTGHPAWTEINSFIGPGCPAEPSADTRFVRLGCLVNWDTRSGLTDIGEHRIEEALPADISGFVPGTLPANETVFAWIATRHTLLPTGLSGSQSRLVTATAAAKDFTIKKNGTDIGYIQFAAGGTWASAFQFGNPITFAPGDVMTIHSPSTADATLAGFHFTLKAYQ